MTVADVSTEQLEAARSSFAQSLREEPLENAACLYSNGFGGIHLATQAWMILYRLEQLLEANLDALVEGDRPFSSTLKGSPGGITVDGVQQCALHVVIIEWTWFDAFLKQHAPWTLNELMRLSMRWQQGG